MLARQLGRSLLQLRTAPAALATRRFSDLQQVRHDARNARRLLVLCMRRRAWVEQPACSG